jgi:hypothetical protein
MTNARLYSLAAVIVATAAASCAPHVHAAAEERGAADLRPRRLHALQGPNGAPRHHRLADHAAFGLGRQLSEFFTACTAQTVKYAGGYVIVHFCAQAFGAGGGCADGGDYRSRDGEHHWQFTGMTGHWDPLPS